MNLAHRLDPDLWTLAFGHRSRRTRVDIGAGHVGARRFGLGMVRETGSINRRQSTADPTNGPDAISGSSVKFRSLRLSIFIARRPCSAFACAPKGERSRLLCWGETVPLSLTARNEDATRCFYGRVTLRVSWPARSSTIRTFA